MPDARAGMLLVSGPSRRTRRQMHGRGGRPDHPQGWPKDRPFEGADSSPRADVSADDVSHRGGTDHPADTKEHHT